MTQTGRKMVTHGVLDHFHQLDTGVGGGYAVLVEQLDHQPTEPLEGPGDPRGGVYLYQHVVGRSDVDLEFNSSLEAGENILVTSSASF